MTAPMTTPSSSPTMSPSGSPSDSPPGLNYMNFDKAVGHNRVSMVAFTQLQDLMKGLTEFSGEMLEKLPGNNPTLAGVLVQVFPTIFRKNKTRSLFNEELNDLLQCCPSLQILNLSRFHQISDAVLPQIATLVNLTSLNLFGTQVSRLDPLIQSLPHLTSVNLLHTKISADSHSFREFLRQHPCIIHLAPPLNPPQRFFTWFASHLLESITLQVEKPTETTISSKEINEFITGNTPRLRTICIIFDGMFESVPATVKHPLCARKVDLTSRNFTGIFDLKPVP